MRDITQRRRAEDALLRAHDELETRVQERTAALERASASLRQEVAERAVAQSLLAETLAIIERSRDDVLSVLDRLRIGAALVDEHGHVTLINQAACALFDTESGRVLGRHWREALAFSERDLAQLATTLTRLPAERARVPVQVASTGERRYWMEVEIEEDPRAPGRMIFLFYDVSEVQDLRHLLDERGRFHGLVGRSRPMVTLYQQVARVAAMDSIVLIEGETGTGKEVVARAVHFLSERRDAPFIAVNCAGLTESLVASQLFGHRRGSFTGATTDQQGLFEAAAGGTLFLDEIGDVPPATQTSLLRVLEAREIVRIGEARPRQVDVRVIAATHHSLSEDVERGTFRADLLYRIRVARITVPALRERREDIPLLIAWFLGQYRAATGKRAEALDRDAMRRLLAYSWPGNVRELRSALEFAVISCKGRVIRLEDLPAEIAAGADHGPLASHPAADPARIQAALRSAGGNRSAAARLLGISRATLYRRLAEEPLRADVPEGSGENDEPSGTPPIGRPRSRNAQ